MFGKNLYLLALKRVQQLTDYDHESDGRQIFPEMPEQGVIAPAFHHSFPGSVCITAEDEVCASARDTVRF